MLAATLIAVAAGQLSFKPNWSAEPMLACALGGLLLALAGDELAHTFDLAGRWRSTLRIGAGALLIIAGQLAEARTTIVLAHLPSGERASNFFKLDVPNADDVLFALLLFALGIVFVARGVFPFDALNRQELDRIAGTLLVGMMRGPDAAWWLCRLCDTSTGDCPIGREAARRCL